MALGKFHSSLIVIIVVLILVCSSAHLDVFFMANNNSLICQNDIFYKMFGQLRSSIAAILYLKADRYFHGGTSHPKHNAGHSCLEGEVPHEHVSKQNNEIWQPVNDDQDIFSRLNKAISYKPVQHLNNAKSAEIMPWFELAVLADPYYIKAYIVGGYWLGIRLGKSDKAIRFLKNGLRYNPKAWEIYSQIGDIYFIMNNDYVKSIAYFRQAYLFLPREVNNIEKRHVLTLLAASFERIKDYEQSIHYYKKILELYPRDNKLKRRIQGVKKLAGDAQIVNGEF